MYPFKLKQNPFPVNTVAKRRDSVFLGGRRWKVARDRIKESIVNDAKPITVIVGPYGVGKTHLVFNLLNSFEDKGFTTSYIELSGLSSGENPVTKAISQLLHAFRGFREGLVRGVMRMLEEEGTLKEIVRVNFSRFRAWRVRKKVSRYVNAGAEVPLSHEERMFFRDTVLTMLEEQGVDRRMTKSILFAHSWETMLQTMDSTVNALSAMAGLVRIAGKNRIVMAFDELDILEQKDDPHEITEPFRNLINNLPANAHLIFAITKTAMDRVQMVDPGLYRRLDDKNKVCIEFLENPNSEAELFDVVNGILEDAGAERDSKGEDELREVCRLVFTKKKERPLSESLTFFSTLFEMANKNGATMRAKAYELLDVEPRMIVTTVKKEDAKESAAKSKQLEDAIRLLCFRLKEIGKVRKVHERGKRIILKNGKWRVADVFLQDNEGRWVAGEVKVRTEFVEALNVHIPEIVRDGMFKDGSVEKHVDRAVLWYLAKGLSADVEGELEELRRKNPVDAIRMDEREISELMELVEKETASAILEEWGKRLGLLR